MKQISIFALALSVAGWAVKTNAETLKSEILNAASSAVDAGRRLRVESGGSEGAYWAWQM
jgi:hypothetical protein